MAHAKQASKRKRRRKVGPVLGAAGLSLSLATAASAAVDKLAADTPTRNPAVSEEIALYEQEISDVSLATFHVFDKENADALRAGIKRTAFGGCGVGCGGCGGCWTGTYYDSSIFGNAPAPPHKPAKPARKRAHTPKRTDAPKGS